MAAYERIQIDPYPPRGAFEVEYRDTLRPNRRIIERYEKEGEVTVAEAARILERSPRTIYNWIEAGDLDVIDGTPVQIPLNEIRRILREEWEDQESDEDEDLDEDDGDEDDEDLYDDDEEEEED